MHKAVTASTGWPGSARGRAAHALCSAVICLVLSLATHVSPAAAPAVLLETDEIGGTPLGVSGLHAHAPDVDAASGMVLGLDGRVLWARDTSARRSVASITKIMTALVVLERSDLDDVVTVSEAASRAEYATGLEPGERRTVRELLELALVASSNDAATALAEHVGGDISGFAAMMNARATEAGLNGTRFANPHGLDAENHYSCADDVAELSRIAMELAEYRRMMALESVTLPAFGTRSGPRTIENTNRLLGEYHGLLVGKTGFTNQAKYCFAGTAERDGTALWAIVLGACSSDARFAETSRLLDWGFEHLTVRTIATETETVSAVPLAQNLARSVDVRFAETSETAVFALDGPIVREVETAPAVDVPVFEGQPLGEVTLTQGERVLATLLAVAAEDVASAEETVGLVPVSDYLDRTVLARATGDPIEVPEFDPDCTVERSIRLDPQVAAPVAVGDPVGTITYTQNGTVIVEVPVVAAEEIPAPGFLERAGIWLQRAFRWITGRSTTPLPEIILD